MGGWLGRHGFAGEAGVLERDNQAVRTREVIVAKVSNKPG